MIAAKTSCDCGAIRSYEQCCQPYHQGKKIAETPEILMRSRYSAYAKANIPYIQSTMTGKASDGFDPVSAQLWASGVTWISLQVIHAEMISTQHGQVEFIAVFVDEGSLHHMHELSEFRLIDGRWYYVDGISLPSDKESPISRNMPCPCGSHKKWKHCHGRLEAFQFN